MFFYVLHTQVSRHVASDSESLSVLNISHVFDWLRPTEQGASVDMSHFSICRLATEWDRRHQPAGRLYLLYIRNRNKRLTFIILGCVAQH